MLSVRFPFASHSFATLSTLPFRTIECTTDLLPSARHAFNSRSTARASRGHSTRSSGSDRKMTRANNADFCGESFPRANTRTHSMHWYACSSFARSFFCSGESRSKVSRASANLGISRRATTSRNGEGAVNTSKSSTENMRWMSAEAWPTRALLTGLSKRTKIETMCDISGIKGVEATSSLYLDRWF